MSKPNNISRKLALDSPDRKRSVFERLGTKSSSTPGKNVCHSWAQNGTCSLNKTCKYAHTHVLISPSKRSKAEAMKKQSLIVQKRTGKEDHKKSSRSHQCTEPEWEGWELGDLEEADEKALERRKQELQRELQLQLKKEKELTRKKEKRNDKKRASSSSSSSTSTTESSSSTTSSSSSSSEPRKRQGRKRKHGSTSFESDVSSHRPRKSPKTVKVKVSSSKKNIEKKDNKSASDTRSKSVVVTKKTVLQKKSSSPVWEKSRARTPHSKQQQSSSSKKASPHHSPVDSKNKSPSPRYDRSLTKSKARTSPKLKVKEPLSPKRPAKKMKESSLHTKDKMRPSPAKSRSSPGRVHKVSPGRSRRHDDSSDKRRGHYEDRKHSPRRERSRDKDRKRETRRGHSNENDNGGLKKGGKILPLKPSSYAKDNGVKTKESSRRKSSEKNSEVKGKDVDCEKEKIRTDRDKERNEKEKSKSERDKLKHKKGSDTHDRHSGRDRDSDRASLRSRDDRNRDRETERIRLAKEREAERQKERDEALERCRERQRERERLEKERKKDEDKKHQRDANDGKQKECDRDLPSLLDLKTENPRGHGDPCSNSKNSDKHSQRETRRNMEKGSEKSLNQDRDGRDRERLLQRSQGSPPDKDHDRRELRRTDDSERRQSDKEYELRRNRDSDVRHSSDLRRAAPINRRPLDDSDCRRPWDDIRRVMDSSHDRRRILDPGLDDRRSLSLLRRTVDEPYDYRRAHDDPDLDVRDFPPDDRRARKLLHGFHHDSQDWDPKNPDLEYRDAELRDDWNHPDRHHDWAVRYDHKWLDREDTRDWNHYSRRPPHDDWNSDWAVGEEQSRSMYREPNDDQMGMMNEGFADHNGRRHNDMEPQPHLEPCKEQPHPPSQQDPRWEKGAKPEGDALSDISDDPDDILNQEDEINETEAAPATAAAAVTTTTTVTTTVMTTTSTAATTTATTTTTTTTASENVAHHVGNVTTTDGGSNAETAATSASGTGSSVQNSNHQIYVRNNDFFFDQRRPLLECFGERALDFEEISDEELEEEARAGKGIMDVLGADWAGLIKDVKPRSKRSEGPVIAHRRWMVDKLISRLGISVKYAGREFADELVEKYKEVKQEEERKQEVLEPVAEKPDIKQEAPDEEDNSSEDVTADKLKEGEKNITVNVTVKIETDDADGTDDKSEIGIHLFHDVPALHNSLRECKNYRASLFLSHNRFKRALSARTDLALRRELCNLPPKEPLHFTPPLDNKMYENSVKLFQRS